MQIVCIQKSKILYSGNTCSKEKEAQSRIYHRIEIPANCTLHTSKYLPWSSTWAVHWNHPLPVWMQSNPPMSQIRVIHCIRCHLQMSPVCLVPYKPKALSHSSLLTPFSSFHPAAVFLTSYSAALPLHSFLPDLTVMKQSNMSTNLLFSQMGERPQQTLVEMFPRTVQKRLGWLLLIWLKIRHSTEVRDANYTLEISTPRHCLFFFFPPFSCLLLFRCSATLSGSWTCLLKAVWIGNSAPKKDDFSDLVFTFSLGKPDIVAMPINA